MTKSQERAVQQIKAHVEQRLDKNPERGDQVTEFKVVEGEYNTVWVSVQTEMTGLPECNMLRVLSHYYWFAEIGKRGAITLHQYPQSYKQFSGQRAFGFNIK